MALFRRVALNPARSSVRAREFPFLIVDDSPQSLKNANIKCWFSDKGFNSFIPYATDTAHGLLMDDGIGCTDAEGNAYDALPNGDYTIAAVLKDRNGRTLAAAKKRIFDPARQNGHTLPFPSR